MASAYSPEQIDRYLEYISLPPKYRRNASPPLDLDFLSTLHSHQLSAIPYENLVIHYNPEHKNSLDTQDLYEKLTHNGRGGYCMESSLFFNHVLHALGFKAYVTGARIRLRVGGVPEGEYIGWMHIVNIVTLQDGSKYMIDVSFGGDGAIHPLPLISSRVTRNIGTQELRLVWDNIPGQTTAPSDSQKLWVYQYRNSADKPWNSFYCFAEMEFLHQDFLAFNYYTSTHPGSFQTFQILVVKFLRKEETSEIYGKVMLVDGVVKRNTGGRTEVVQVCETEAERVQALREWFGIELTSEEMEGIRGWRTELKGK
ncbi:MAG: N-terminal acetyltransferase [Bogoriella megaspora]|nr:MAG: N-terminal acetyltransferase [Bogoriella megaspora]